MRQYEHLFFDLDKTLWDFEENTRSTFRDLYSSYDLYKKGVDDVEDFYTSYEKINNQLWEQYRQGVIEKEFLSVQRFILTLNEFDIDDTILAENISREYIRISPYKTLLLPGASDVLQYLKEKYKLHIITNGFNEIQFIKIKESGLNMYFDNIITSENAGCKKPNENIFYYALEKANATAEESLMIGDDLEVDIVGASSAGIDQVFVNSGKTTSAFTATFEINSLFELMKIL